MTTTWAGIASGAAAIQLDELGPLALGQPADGLARRDPALLEDLFAFTRPYFGVASRMSKTLAVWRYSGG